MDYITCYQFDSIGGDAGSELMNSMTLGGIGDGIQGVFDVEKLTFSQGTTTAGQTQ